jgi:adenylosuccinate synthase
LINPTVTGIIGSGVVVHLPSFFKEFEALEAQGQHRLRFVHPWLSSRFFFSFLLKD